MRRIMPLLLMLPMLACLSACPESVTERKSYKEPMTGEDKPLAFKARTLGYIKRPPELGKYVCEGLETQLQDRYIHHKQYSAAFILKTLSELPATLQNTYATCYLEAELKEEGFGEYFNINQAFLGPQALAGYKAFGAVNQIKILAKALELGKLKPKTAKDKTALAKELAKLDLQWAALDPKQLLALRGDYSRRRFDAGEWPTTDKR
ncbi:MAG TPA: hypothetical protein V6D23_27945 [Candidatus Obscuribacterales bacterium]